MAEVTRLTCRCGQVELEVRREPIIRAECHCTSCRTAGSRLATLPGALPIQEANGGTQYVLYRKDRVTFTRGEDRLKGFRLTEKSGTRRVVATCCNTPIFTEFQDGHWLSLYARLWPETMRPKPDIRTQTGDRTDPAPLDSAVPYGRRQTLGFYGRLLGAWVAMGFRTPAVPVSGEIKV
jgi:hypothetical protein